MSERPWTATAERMPKVGNRLQVRYGNENPRPWTDPDFYYWFDGESWLVFVKGRQTKVNPPTFWRPLERPHAAE